MKKRRKQNRIRITRSELEDLKRLLGPIGDDYTTEELLQVMRRVRALAEVLVDLRKQYGKNGDQLPSIKY
jgi:hypothetical protein